MTENQKITLISDLLFQYAKATCKNVIFVMFKGRYTIPAVDKTIPVVDKGQFIITEFQIIV
jgi:hypothetical protein